MDRRDSECRLVEGWEPSKFLASMGSSVSKSYRAGTRDCRSKAVGIA